MTPVKLTMHEGNTIIRFGKHEGDTYDEIVRRDPSYCNWVLSINSTFPPMIKFQHYLEDFDFFRGSDFGCGWDYYDDWNYDYAPVY